MFPEAERRDYEGIVWRASPSRASRHNAVGTHDAPTHQRVRGRAVPR